MTTIARLFPTIETARFLAEHFLRGEPLVHHGEWSRLAVPKLAGPEDVEDLLKTQRHAGISAVFRDSNDLPRHLYNLGNQAWHAYRAGATISIENFHHPIVESFSKSILDETGFPACCAANAAFLGLTRSGSYWHTDNKDIFVIQLFGSKQWSIAPNRHAPRAVSNICRDPSRECLSPWGPSAEIEELVLEPGSALFLPRNWWHRTVVTEGPCMAITLGVRRPTYLVLLLAALHAHFIEDPSWLDAVGPISGTSSASGLAASQLLALIGRSANELPQLDYGNLLAELDKPPTLVKRYRMSPSVQIEQHQTDGVHCFQFQCGDVRTEMRCDARAAAVAAAILEQPGNFCISEIARQVAPDDPESVRQAVKVLIEAGYLEDADSVDGVIRVTLGSFQTLLMGR